MKRMGCAVMVFVLLAAVLPVGAGAVDLDIDGKSALLMDVATGTVLYEKNAHEALPPASVTKVMTMLLIMEAIDSGKIGWEDMVTASESAAAKGGSQIYLKVGETMSVSDMVKSIAVSSANDCACAMAEHLAGSESAFVDRMNARAKELGMNDTHFVNCTGLDDGADAAEHKTSAYDIGQFGISNTNKLIRFYSGATGLKTGFTSGAGYCLSATAQREGMELIAVVMGCETSQKRTAACKAMLDYGFANFAVISPAREENAEVPVVLGKADGVALKPSGAGALLIDKAQKSSVTIRTVREENVEAPVSLGQRLGTMTVLAGEQVLAEIPLVAAEAVERLTFRDLFVQVLRMAAMAKKNSESPN